MFSIKKFQNLISPLREQFRGLKDVKWNKEIKNPKARSPRAYLKKQLKIIDLWVLLQNDQIETLWDSIYNKIVKKNNTVTPHTSFFLNWSSIIKNDYLYILLMSIYEITPETLTPRFLEACRREGFHSSELMKKTLDQVTQIVK